MAPTATNQPSFSSLFLPNVWQMHGAKSCQRSLHCAQHDRRRYNVVPPFDSVQLVNITLISAGLVVDLCIYIYICFIWYNIYIYTFYFMGYLNIYISIVYIYIYGRYTVYVYSRFNGIIHQPTSRLGAPPAACRPCLRKGRENFGVFPLKGKLLNARALRSVGNPLGKKRMQI